MKNTNVTIIIPIDKNRGFLTAAVESAQYQAKVEIYQSENSVGYNVNRALEQIDTKYYCVLAEDDLLPIGSIRNRFNFMEKNMSDFIHSYGVAFDNRRRYQVAWTDPKCNLEKMLVTNRICGGTTMYRTDLVQKFGGWDEDLWTSEEYDYHLRLLYEGVKLDFLPESTYLWRRHDLQKSIGNKSGEYQAKRFKVKVEIQNRYK